MTEAAHDAVRISSWSARLAYASGPAMAAAVFFINGTFLAGTEGMTLYVSTILTIAAACGVLCIRALFLRLVVSADRVVVANLFSTRTVPTESIAVVQTGLIVGRLKPWPIVGLWLVVRGDADARRPKRLHIDTCRGRRLVLEAIAAFEDLGLATDDSRSPWRRGPEPRTRAE